jgi:serine/threonine protein kinase
MIPERFGTYLLVSQLGARGPVERFVAIRLGDAAGAPVVIKRARLGERASGSAARSIEQEGEALEALEQAGAVGLVRLVERGSLAGLPFVATELVRGVPLSEALREGPLSVEAARCVGAALARTLTSMHEAGWVHGDVTPSNVLVGEDGELTTIDLGLAARSGARRDAPAGTPGYAAPNAAAELEVRTADDVFGWGVLVAECLLGSRLFPGETALVDGVRRDLDPTAASVPEALVARALARHAADRPSAAELAASWTSAKTTDATHELAERVRRALATQAATNSQKSRPIRAETTSSFVEVTPSALGGTDVIGDARAVVVNAQPPERSPSTTSRGPSRVRRTIAAALVAALATGALGYVIGARRATRQLRTTLVAPLLPANVEIALDGKALVTTEPGRPIPIAPGRHELTLTVGRREPKEAVVHVERGEQIVVIPLVAPRSGAAR